MGQFLAIGLVLEIGIDVNSDDTKSEDIKLIQENMKQQLYHVPELYEISENNCKRLLLREELLHTQLLPFLNVFYPLLYGKNNPDCGFVLDKLQKLPPSEWISWAKGKPEDMFQLNEYGNPDYISMNHRKVRISYDTLLISMGGKIMMTVYRRQFNFFKYTIMQAFKQFSLAGALRVYITG